MKIFVQALLCSMILSRAAIADIGAVPSVDINAEANAVPVTPPNLKATQLPRRDTKTSLVCSSADAAPKLADRSSEGSCRSHTKEHAAEAQKSMPAVPTADVHAITGR